MKFNLDTFGGGYSIRAYAAGTVTIIGPGESATPFSEVLDRSFVISPQELWPDWPPQQYQELTAEHFVGLLALEPEVVLFGTGEVFRYPAPALLAPLLERGIGVEAMDTGAACRTYNVLAAEGRRVVAAILMEPV